MNLSAEWVPYFVGEGIAAAHWAEIGDPRADDVEIMAWASANANVVFTHDLDFGTTLALTGATGPSVIQVRGPAVLPEQIGAVVAAAMRQFEPELAGGAIVVIEHGRSRVRILPLGPGP